MRRAAATALERVSSTVLSRCSASCWFGVTMVGSASMPRESASPSVSSRVRTFFCFARFNEPGVEIGGHAGGKAAAEHEPGGGSELGFDGGFDAGDFFAIEARAGFVELDGEAVAVGDSEVEADVVADRHGGDGKAAMIHEFLEAHGGFAAGGENGESLAAEIMDDAGGVDAASTGGIVAGQDVGAIVKGEAVDGDGPVDGRIHGEGDDQLDMVAYGTLSGRRIAGVAGCRLDESGCSAAWLARLLGVQEVPGSNPGSPTNLKPLSYLGDIHGGSVLKKDACHATLDLHRPLLT